MFILAFAAESFAWICGTLHIAHRLYTLPIHAEVTAQEWLGTLVYGLFMYGLVAYAFVFGQDTLTLAFGAMLAAYYMLFLAAVWVLCLFFEERLPRRITQFLNLLRGI